MSAFRREYHPHVRRVLAVSVVIAIAGAITSAAILWIRNVPEVLRGERGSVVWYLRVDSAAIRSCPVVSPDGPVTFESALGQFVDHGEDPADVHPIESLSYWSTASRDEVDTVLESWAGALGHQVVSRSRDADATMLELSDGKKTLRFDTYVRDGRTHVHVSEER